MTEAQKAAAERALRKLELTDLQKRVALRRRNQCIKDVIFYKLPFRVLYDLKQPSKQVPLSYFYPYRACSADMEEQTNEERTKNGGYLTVEAVQRLETAEYTPEALRDYYFTCFLFGVDLGAFRAWDWTGEPIAKEKEEALKMYYTARQQDFLDNPGKYAAPALKQNDDMSRYSPKRQELLRFYDEVMKGEANDN